MGTFILALYYIYTCLFFYGLSKNSYTLLKFNHTYSEIVMRQCIIRDTREIEAIVPWLFVDGSVNKMGIGILRFQVRRWINGFFVHLAILLGLKGIVVIRISWLVRSHRSHLLRGLLVKRLSNCAFHIAISRAVHHWIRLRCLLFRWRDFSLWWLGFWIFTRWLWQVCVRTLISFRGIHDVYKLK